MRRLLALALPFLLCVAAVTAALVPAVARPPRSKVPPPTPVPPFGSPSPFPTALDTPEPSSDPPEVSAASAALVDIDSGQLLFQHNPMERRPIASVTKIMTALLVTEDAKPGEVVEVSTDATSQEGAILGLLPGERIPVRELLFALLLPSANDAAVALSEHISGSVRGFVGRMNERARQLGLRDTRFASPSGLDDSGYSTARDLAAVTVEAFRNTTFSDVIRSKFHTIPAPRGPDRHLQNRNALLWLYQGALGGKTGYTSAAGFCLVAAAEREGLRLAAVVLGAPVDPFSDAAALLNYGFEAFERRRVVKEGQRFDPLTVGGNEVPVAADVGLHLLLRRGEEVDLAVRPEGGLALPVAGGERVGSVVIRGQGKELGRVPLVASRSVRLNDQDETPLWERMWDAVAGFLAGLWRALFG